MSESVVVTQEVAESVVTTVSPTSSVIETAAGPRGESMIPFARPGELNTLVGKQRYRFPFAARVIGVSTSLGTPAVGADIVVAVNKNGAPVVEVTIPAGAAETSEAAVSELVAIGDYLTVDLTQVGSTTPGADLSVFIRYIPA